MGLCHSAQQPTHDTSIEETQGQGQHAAAADSGSCGSTPHDCSVHTPAHATDQTPAKMSRSHPFDRLAAVECQLILQYLDNKSRLRAARCSRTLRAEASHPFSWKYAEPILLRSSKMAERLPLLESSLLRLAPIHLHVDRQLQSAADMPAILRLRGIQSQEYHFFRYDADPATAWVELLSHPNVQQLRTLHCSLDSDLSSHLALVAQLPHLTSLAFRVSHGAEPEQMALLSAAPGSLTSIRTAFSQDTPEVNLAALQALTRMPQLRRLWLAYPQFQASTKGEAHCASLRSFLTSPALAHLTHLTLEGLDIRGIMGRHVAIPPTSDDCAAAFSALAHLTHLRLVGLAGIDLLLTYVPRARSLVELSVFVWQLQYHPLTQPRVDVLRGVFDAMPLLHVSLTPVGFEPTAAEWPAHAACAQLPRVTITASIGYNDILQDEH